MITLEQYLMGRDKNHPIDVEQAKNAADLLSRVNWLFAKLNIVSKVSSGYRPEAINNSVNGAKKSAHISCQAIDVSDPFGKIGLLLRSRTDLLEQAGLYLENPDFTFRVNADGSRVRWVHVQSRKTSKIVFNP